MIELKERIFVKVVFERKASTIVVPAHNGRIGNHDATPIPPIRALPFWLPAAEQKAGALKKNIALCGSHR
jgi:hypothetical protein